MLLNDLFSNSKDMQCTITQATEAADLQQCLQIRQRVFVEEQGIPAELDRDGLDGQALHVLVWAEQEVAGTGRLLPLSGGRGHIARIAVLPPFRGRGLGKKIVTKLEKLAQSVPLKEVVLDCHSHLQQFYAQMGYTPTGKTSMVHTHLLIQMKKEL
ncbi:MAG: GNAT family N-acetyltransferase [Bacteroidetes bacterium]|nr:MAG: GNAT family N-acetyltransferase [Bacteroidota bacterium]